jgi:hypothetical protein
MFRFGWLTITAEDLAVWEQFPNAAFTLVSRGHTESTEEFRLGSFELRDAGMLSGRKGEEIR